MMLLSQKVEIISYFPPLLKVVTILVTNDIIFPVFCKEKIRMGLKNESRIYSNGYCFGDVEKILRMLKIK